MLADLSKRYDLKPISTEEFRLFAAQYLPPKSDDPKLESFFEHWVYGTGVPSLKMTYAMRNGKLTGTVTQIGRGRGLHSGGAGGDSGGARQDDHAMGEDGVEPRDLQCGAGGAAVEGHAGPAPGGTAKVAGLRPRRVALLQHQHGHPSRRFPGCRRWRSGRAGERRAVDQRDGAHVAGERAGR